MIKSVSNNVRMTTHPPFFSTNIGGVRIGGGGVNISGGGDISHSRSSEPQMHFSTGRGMVYLVEFTPTTQGEDDGNPLRCPEKDEDLLRLKQGGDPPPVVRSWRRISRDLQGLSLTVRDLGLPEQPRVRFSILLTTWAVDSNQMLLQLGK